jgi:hypothetical protein
MHAFVRWRKKMAFPRIAMPRLLLLNVTHHFMYEVLFF